MADPVDIHVGRKIRNRRTLLKLSQVKLAEALGITFQQVQKYENGTNRVSASRLHAIGKILDVPTSYFFEGISEAEGVKVAESRSGLRDDVMSSKETLDLVGSYYAISDPAVRRKVLDMIKSLG